MGLGLAIAKAVVTGYGGAIAAQNRPEGVLSSRSRLPQIVLIFGSFSSELAPGARNAVDVCLNIQPGERVALIADEASREVAASLDHALALRGAHAQPLLIESIATRPIRARRRRSSTASNAPTPESCACSRRKGSCPRAWRSSRSSSDAGFATPTLVGVTPQIDATGMRADYRKVDRLSEQLCERMPHARRSPCRPSAAPTSPPPSIRRSPG